PQRARLLRLVHVVPGDRHGHGLRGLPGGEGQRPGGRPVVAGRGGRTVGGGVVHGHRLLGASCQRDREVEVRGAGIPLVRADVPHRQGVRGVVVHDGPQAGSVGEGRAGGVGQIHGEGLVGLVDGVPVHGHGERRGRLPPGEGEGARDGRVVRRRGGRAV